MHGDYLGSNHRVGAAVYAITFAPEDLQTPPRQVEVMHAQSQQLHQPEPRAIGQLHHQQRGARQLGE
jgi:hypothetical protein